MQDDSSTKRCSKCGVTKLRSAFQRDARKPDGLHGNCRDCRRETTDRYYAEHRDVYRERSRKYHAKRKGERRMPVVPVSLPDVVEPVILNQGYWEAFPKNKHQWCTFPGVYVVKQRDGLIKVGIATNMHQRLRMLNRVHPLTHVYALYRVEDRGGRVALERSIHWALASHTAWGYEDRFTDDARVLDILADGYGFEWRLFAGA